MPACGPEGWRTNATVKTRVYSRSPRHCSPQITRYGLAFSRFLRCCFACSCLHFHQTGGKQTDISHILAMTAMYGIIRSNVNMKG